MRSPGVRAVDEAAHLEVLGARSWCRRRCAPAARRPGRARLISRRRPGPAISRVLEAHAAAARPQQAGDQLEQRRLAGAVGADQRDDLAGVDAEVGALHDLVGRARSRRAGRRSPGGSCRAPSRDRPPARDDRRAPRRRCPAVSTRPSAMTITGSQRRAMKSMSCSISSTVMPRARQLEQLLADLVLQRRVDAGDRLVEQHQPAARPSARGRSPAASSGRPTARWRDCRSGGRAAGSAPSPTPARPAGLALARGPRADDRLPQALARLVAAVEHEVLEHRQPGKAARDLEGAHQPAPADAIGRQPVMSLAVEARPSRASGGTRPETQLNSVVLPAPLGPISPVMPPAATARSTPRSTSRP